MSQDHAYALPAGYRLEEYRIEGVLGSGGFGITYSARRPDFPPPAKTGSDCPADSERQSIA